MAAPMVAGKRVILVGGDERQQAVRRLERELGCTIEWVRTSDKDARLPAMPSTRNAACVVVLMKWIRHNTHRECVAWCKRHGMPVSIHWGGYGVNSIANSLLKNDQLRGGGGGGGRHVPCANRCAGVYSHA